MRFVWKPLGFYVVVFVCCQCPPGPWRCALRGAAGRKCPWSSWGGKGKSWNIIEHDGKIMEQSWKNPQWKITNGKSMEDTDFCFKPIAGSEEFESRRYRILKQPSHRRLHLVLPWGRRERHSPCHGPESVLVFMVRHMNLKKGAWKMTVSTTKNI